MTISNLKMGSSKVKNSLCIFCYTPANPRILNHQDDFNEIHCFNQFSKYIHLHKGRYEQVPTSELRFCESCKVIAKSFCDCYSKLELLHLEMSSKLEKVLKRMTAADNVPSKLTSFQMQFKSLSDVDCQVVDSDFNNIYWSIKELRTDFITHCK